MGICVSLKPDGTLVETFESFEDCSYQWLATPDEFPQPVLPPLSAAEGSLVGAAIVGVWVAGAWVRWLRRAL